MFGIKPENMHAATIDEILDSYKAPDGSTILAGPTSFSSYLGTHVSQSFHDYTLVGRALEEREIQKKEKEAGHYDPIYNAALGGDSQISYNSGDSTF